MPHPTVVNREITHVHFDRDFVRIGFVSDDVEFSGEEFPQALGVASRNNSKSPQLFRGGAKYEFRRSTSDELFRNRKCRESNPCANPGV